MTKYSDSMRAIDELMATYDCLGELDDMAESLAELAVSRTKRVLSLLEQDDS